MSAFRRRGKFTFKRVGSRLEGNARVEEKEAMAVSNLPKRNGNLVATSVRSLGLNPYNECSGKIESPAKRTKYDNGNKLPDDLIDDFDDFDNEFMIDLDNDDFSKNLTVDYLNTLELEASQRVKDKPESSKNNQDKLHNVLKTELNAAVSSKLVKNDQEQTLDLFSTGQTIDRTIVDRSHRESNFAVNNFQTGVGDYKKRVAEMEEAMLVKEGEIKMLRQNLGHTQEERESLKTQIQSIRRNISGEKSENEKRLERELEKLQTQLQFKNKEIKDIKESRQKYDNTRTPLKIIDSGSFSHQTPTTSKTISLFDNTTFSKSGTVSSNTIEKKKSLRYTDVKIKDGILNEAQPSFNSINCDQTYIESELLDLIAKPFNGMEFPDTMLQNLDINDDAKLTGNAFIRHCIQELQGSGWRNTEGIIEVLEPHLAKLLQCVRDVSQPKDVDLFCKETSTSCNGFGLSSIEKQDACSKLADFKYGINALSVLRIITKYDSSTQRNFLAALSTKWMDNSKMKEESSSIKSFKSCDNLKVSETCVSVPRLGSFREVMNHLVALSTCEQCPECAKERMFDVLLSLSSCCSSTSKTGLVELLGNGRILSMIPSNVKMKTISSFLAVLKSLSDTKGVENILCSVSANCLLARLYKVFVKRLEDCSDSQWKDLKLEIVHTLSTIISCCPKALRIMLDSGCECGSELTKCLILMLFEEYKSIRKDYLLQTNIPRLINSKGFLLLRQGITLLSHVSLCDKRFLDHRVEVEWQYLDLVYGTIRLYRRIPSISENEVLMVQDLRDIDQFDDFENSADGLCPRFSLEQDQ